MNRILMTERATGRCTRLRFWRLGVYILQARNIVQACVQMLSLVNCADTIVGDGMVRGVSGGEKKRVTTGEVLVGPSKVLFMDEISTGVASFALVLATVWHDCADLSLQDSAAACERAGRAFCRGAQACLCSTRRA